MSAKHTQADKVRHGLNLPGVKPIDMRKAFSRNKRSIVRESNAFHNAEKVLTYFKEKGGPDPYEGYTILDMEEAKQSDKELTKMKTAFFSFVTGLKELVKEMGLEEEVEVVARGNNLVHLGNTKD